jgi:serine/threonine protein phosphatase PrpC
VLVDRNPRYDEFIVLACDGVWDVLSCRQCGDLIQNILDEGELDLSLVVEELLDVCLDRQSKDNMTALLVSFPAMRVGQGGGVAFRRELRQQRRAVEERKRKRKNSQSKNSKLKRKRFDNDLLLEQGNAMSLTRIVTE